MTRTKLQRAPMAYSPFTSTLSRDLNEMRDRVQRLVETPFGRLFPEPFAGESAQAVGWYPVVELSESDKEFMIVAELPGMKGKDVQVDFADGMLTIRGEKQEQRDEQDKEKKYHVWERSYGTFLRTFEFPAPIDEENIRAEHRDGLLEVHLPKKGPEKAQGKHIDVVDKV